MNPVLYNVLQFTKTLLDLYILVLFVRIILSWAGSIPHSGAVSFLRKITDPYLNLFRGIRWLRFGMLDLSVILGIIMIQIVSRLLGRVIDNQAVTLGIIVFTLIKAFFSIVSFILTILIVLSLLRLITLRYIRSGSPFWFTLDNILSPLVEWINRKKRRSNDFDSYKKDWGYETGLIVIVLVCIAIIIGLQIALPYLALLIARIGI